MEYVSGKMEDVSGKMEYVSGMMEDVFLWKFNNKIRNVLN
jgi:hypothetical protein